MHLIINLNKPMGITSQQAVTKVKKILGVRKAGHAGTLDPLATGVLLVCLGEATKIVRFFVDMDKKYRARLKLGERTDTCDAEGRIIERRDISFLSSADIDRAIMSFSGIIMQKPPMYSAVKIGGETLYKLARKGIEIERPERQVNIYYLKITDIDLPFVDLEVACSKGTYIRTLCDDIGIKLSAGAHLVSLERTGIGFFGIEDSVTFDDLLSYESCSHDESSSSMPEKRADRMQGEYLVADEKSFYSVDSALAAVEEIILGDEEYKKARNGMKIMTDKIRGKAENTLLRMKGPGGNLFGIGRVNSGVLSIERILKL
ncbi:MAG: tRNA pseudouridine(55) synthase TruB [Nitrospirae bacterium]|nr:tRNA pseudouridine(55) synthase TruB [Nitrospirota bacterium]